MERIRTVVGWLGVLGYIVLVVIASENQQFHASFMFSVRKIFPHLTVHRNTCWYSGPERRSTSQATVLAFVATTPVWAQEG